MTQSSVSCVITVSRPVNGVGVSADEYLTAEGGETVRFETVKKAINFLADRNYAIAELRELDFNLEEDGAAPELTGIP
jgi:hypothetical protein